MSEEVKFTEEELKEVQNIQQGYNNIQNQFGQLKLAKIRLDQQMMDLENQEAELEAKILKSVQDKEKKFLDSITEKYGQGSLDPTTGVFTPLEKDSTK